MRQSKDILEALIDYRRDKKKEDTSDSDLILQKRESYDWRSGAKAIETSICKIDEEDWMYFFNKHKKFYKEELKEELSDLIEEQDNFIKTIENIKEF